MTKERKTKILIVEDETIIRKAYAEELNDHGFDVLTAENGSVGLEITSREKPDLILLDVLMPVMDGFTMMNEVRKHGEYGKHVPIILLTNLPPNEDKIMRTISKDEPAYYLVKSDYTLSDILKKIENVLRKK